MKPNRSCINLRPPSLSPSPTYAAKVDKNRRKSHDEKTRRSTNSVSLRSASPANDATFLKEAQQQQLQQNQLESNQAKSTQVPSAVAAANNGNTSSGDTTSISTNNTVKRKSLSDVMVVQGSSSSTSNPNKNDLRKNSKQNQLDSTVSPNSNTMLSSIAIATTATIQDSSALTAAMIATNGNKSSSPSPASPGVKQTTQPNLQAESNISTNLSSNSSLYSSSLKSNKSNEATTNTNTIEKKRKATSSSRQKKFHRHFKQVAADEEVINYFSSAFVSDILLQGYLYVTKNYIAFYSNVFGYVTKLLIPIKSVVKISKEKTVKIIPNAIAVATIDERHVFSSFLSREAAYQLMLSVWKEALPNSDIDEMATSALLRSTDANSSSDAPVKVAESKSKAVPIPIKHTLQVVHQRIRPNGCGDLDVSELDDDSSSAISGNESLTQLLQSKNLLVTDLVATNEQSPNNSSNSSNPSNCDLIATLETNSELDASKRLLDADKLTSTPIATSLVKPEKDEFSTSTFGFCKLRIPRKIHIAYFGLSLAIILALVAMFLFYRLVEIKSNRMARSFTLAELNGDAPPNADLYADILKWQKDMQSQRVHLTRNVLANNLEQISKISDSLETLSSLIESSKASNDISEKMSSIVGECSNLETCELEKLETLTTP